MKLGLILGLGICAAATTMALADPPRVVVRHHESSGAHEPGRIDADHDGWVTRAEAAAEADRVFDEMDSNDDGRLNGDDHGRMMFHGDDGGDVVIERRVHRDGAAPEAETSSETRFERRIVIVREGEGEVEWTEGEAPHPPTPPHPPMAAHPPMFVMMIGNSEEFDTNGDGAMSREEFRNQQLRFFNASDGNGDGRVRMMHPPTPPAAPTPPTPPAPPAPPRH